MAGQKQARSPRQRGHALGFGLLAASLLLALLANQATAQTNGIISRLPSVKSATKAVGGVQTAPADRASTGTAVGGVRQTASVDDDRATATRSQAKSTATRVPGGVVIESASKFTSTKTLSGTGSSSSAVTRTGSASSASLSRTGSVSRSGSSSASTRTSASSSSVSSRTGTIAANSGIPGMPVVTNAPKTLVIYLTTTTATPTTTASTETPMTTQLPDGSIITINGNGNAATTSDTVGGVPMKNLIIAACVVGGAVVVGLMGVYGYKYCRGGQRDSLEERKRGKRWGHKKSAAKIEDGGDSSPDGGQWDRGFAWNSPIPGSSIPPSLNKKPSVESLRTGKSGPPSAAWQMSGSTNDLMAALTMSINGTGTPAEINSSGSMPPQMAQVGRGASQADVLTAAGFAPVPKTKPIPAAIITRPMVRSATAPVLPAAAQIQAAREEQLRHTPMSVDVNGTGDPLPAPLPTGRVAGSGTTSVNAAAAMAASGSGPGDKTLRPRSMTNPGLRIEIPYRESQSTPDNLLQRYAKHYIAPTKGSKTKGGSATGSKTLQSTGSQDSFQEKAAIALAAREATWPRKQGDVRASIYAEQAIAHYGKVPQPQSNKPAKLAMPVVNLPTMAPKRTASSNKRKTTEGVPWEAVVEVNDVVDHYGRPSPNPNEMLRGPGM